MNPDEQKARVEKQRTFEADLLRAQEEAVQASIQEDIERKENLKKEGDKVQKVLRTNTGFMTEADIEEEETSEEIEEQSEVENEFSEQEEGIEDDPTSGDSGKPEFPSTFFAISIAKDFVDTVTTLTGIGAILPPIYGPFYDVAFFMWRKKRIGLVKINETKKLDLKERTFGKMVATFIGEEIPVVDLAPLSSYNVYSQYKTEVEMWREANGQKRIPKVKKTN